MIAQISDSASSCDSCSLSPPSFSLSSFSESVGSNVRAEMLCPSCTTCPTIRVSVLCTTNCTAGLGASQHSFNFVFAVWARKRSVTRFGPATDVPPGVRPCKPLQLHLSSTWKGVGEDNVPPLHTCHRLRSCCAGRDSIFNFWRGKQHWRMGPLGSSRFNNIAWELQT